MDKVELIAYIRSIVDSRYGGNQAAFARAIGVSAAYVNDILHDRREPGLLILRAIGCKKIVRYELDTNL